MFKYLTLSSVISLLSLPVYSSDLALNNPNAPEPAKIEFREAKPIENVVKDPLYFQNLSERLPPCTNYMAAGISDLILVEGANTDGYGAGLIVFDTKFERDAAVNYVEQGPHTFSDSIRGMIAHGSTCSSVACSKVSGNYGLAAGAQVYPISWRTHNETTSYYTAEIDRLSEERSCAKTKALDQFRLLTQSGKYDEAEAVLRLDKTLEAEFVQKKSELLKRIFVNEGVAYNFVSLTSENLDIIEKTIFMRRDAKLPPAKVITMSLSFEVSKNDIDTVMPRLESILNNNDILLVVAAGNEGEALAANEQRAGERINVMQIIMNYTELCRRLIIVGAYVENDKLATFSNLAGKASEHFLIANGLSTHFNTYREDGSVLNHGECVFGTSFAAPRVAALAVVLNKYFPCLSMLQIKDIILRTAFKASDHKQEDVGH
jgi:hypothetical protein